ncbi:MAG: S-adenosylmethionine:tRNA ribosyltransferase-isomerase [Kineosporiaceae bacterium]
MSATSAAEPLTTFRLPPGLEAREPPEARGLRRDGVRLLVARPGRVSHRRFRDLAEHLEPGDVLVVNTSATLPAAVDAVRSAPAGRGPAERPVVVHVGGELDDGRWVVEARRPDGTGPERDVVPGEVLRLAGGARLTVEDSYPHGGRPGSRLWAALPAVEVERAAYVGRHGRPVSYGYLGDRQPLTAYATLFSREPGSAEMPSAARPFTADVLVDVVARGVVVAPVVLHCGLSSPDAGEPPAPERLAVPAGTARLVNDAVAGGRRVVAVGTTAVRALESAAGPDGRVAPAAGWTDLVVDRTRPARVVSGLVTGWHAPRASHLSLLEAVAGPDLVRAAYEAALARGYLWHEFGDSCLFLP